MGDAVLSMQWVHAHTSGLAVKELLKKNPQLTERKKASSYNPHHLSRLSQALMPGSTSNASRKTIKTTDNELLKRHSGQLGILLRACSRSTLT